MEFRTHRLLLREFREDDWRDAHLYEKDPETVQYQSFGPYSEEESRAYLARSMADAKCLPRLTFDMALVSLNTPRVIGRVGLHISSVSDEQGVVWYILHRDFWGRGFVPEALQALVEFGFRDLKLHRIWADCDPSNHASIRVVEKLGMRREGHLLENAKLKGRWTSSYLYALLAGEWASKSPIHAVSQQESPATKA